VKDRAHQIAIIRAEIDREPPPAGTVHGTAGELERLCAALARAVKAVSVGITVITEEGAHPVAVASDPRGRLLEEQQDSTGEGPGIDAFALRQPVLVADLDQDLARWPGYAATLLGFGVSAVFAFPLQIGAARLGVLNVYRQDPGMLPPDAVDQTLTFAEIAVHILLEGQRRLSDGRSANGLELAIESRSELFQAQGMVMIQLGIPLAEAIVRLRAYAFAHDRRLGDVAHDVVARRLQLEPDPRSDGSD
jgi:hypothetical protein